LLFIVFSADRHIGFLAPHIRIQLVPGGRDETQNLKNFLTLFCGGIFPWAEGEAQVEGDGVPPRNYLDMPLNMHFPYGCSAKK
jgi:hypothetical protein